MMRNFFYTTENIERENISLGKEIRERHDEWKKEERIKNKLRINIWRHAHKENVKVYTKKAAQNKKRWSQENKEYSREYERKWLKTEKGRTSRLKTRQKRRDKKWIQILPNIFPKEIPVDYHHIDGYMFVAPLPKKIHASTNNGINLKKHLEKANDWIEFYYTMNPTLFLKEDLMEDVLYGEKKQ